MMDSSRQILSTQPTEIIQAKTKTSLKKIRRRKPLRRIWSRGLPSLATNTVKMVVATLQIGSIVNENTTEEEEEEEDEKEIENNDDDEGFHIGQQVQAHIPDIVLNNLDDLIDNQGNILIPNEHMYNQATLLFLDVSGFTSLTEQYSNDAHLGIDQLTHTLNSYFDKLVSEILIHNGDIYKFAGDAILALWTHESNGPEQALKCALSLQERYGAYETNVDVILRMKVAIAYGSVRVLFIGTDEFKHYILTGDCIKDVNSCEQLCEPGDIIITKAVYEQVQKFSLNCEYASIGDESDRNDQYIAVKCLESEEDNMYQSSQELSNGHRSIESKTHSCSLVADSNDEELDDKIDNLMKSFLLGCVYQRIERKQSLDYLSELRRVTITFINLDISDEQHAETDLCQNVQKVFIQIYELNKMMGGVLTKALLFDKGWSFLCVFGLPGYKQGDDTANALKCAHMIHSTINKQCQFINKCSIGVATGLTYCGVVGHVARCEYTVIGRKVNLAARLMCNYPNIISCDQETYYNSRLNSRFFQILPDKILKGMHNVGIIWQYGENQDNVQIQNNSNQKENINLSNGNYPLLGRKLELMIIATQIMLMDEPENKRRDLAAIIFEGDDKIGRSRLLQFIADSFENANYETSSTGVSCYDNSYIPYDSTIPNSIPLTTNDILPNRSSSLHVYGSDCSTIKKPIIRIIKYNCQLERRFNEFSLLRSLLRQLLNFHNDEKSQYEREQSLLRLFDINKSNDLYLRRNLFLLNDLVDVRFRRGHIETDNNNETNFVRTYETNINELLLHIINQLVESPINIADMYGNTCTSVSASCGQPRRSSNSISIIPSSPIAVASKILIIIDDIHFADESSLKHLLTLGSHSKCLLILSMKPPRNNNNDRRASDILQTISTDSRVYLRRLPGLEPRYLATLGCQILSVHKLPAKLVKVFNESCNGIPGFCEQILFDLLRKDKIYIVNTIDEHDQDLNLIEGDADKLLLNLPSKNSLFKSLFSRRKQILNEEQRQSEQIFSRICLLRDPTSNDVISHCQQNFQNYIMCRIDRLSEGETFLIKTAAVIGNTFSRTFLWQLVDSNSKKSININSCILDMMQRSVIECAYKQQQNPKGRTIQCFCLHNPTSFPSQCRLIAFAHVSIREGIYNSLTDSLKRTLTRHAIDYLEKQCTIICSTCGPRNDIPFFVQKQDGLTKIIKTSQQHAFVDIVKIAALKEIDNAIKQSIRLGSLNVLRKPRSNTSSNIPPEPITAPAGNTRVDEHNSPTKTLEKRRNSIDASGFNAHRTRLSLSPYIPLVNEDTSKTKPEQLIRRDSSDQNLPIVNLYSYNNNESQLTPTSVQNDVHRPLTSSKSNPFITLIKAPKKSLRNASLSNNRLLKTIDGFIIPDKTQRKETIVKRTRQRRESRSHRLRSFFRYIFCQIVPLHSPILTTEDTNNQSMRKSTDKETADTHITSKSNSISQESKFLRKYSSHWQTVRQVLIPSPNKVLRACPSDQELLEQPMFSSEFMQHIADDLNCLNRQIYLTRTFQILYDQSLLFHTFQSYVQYKNLIHYVHDIQQQQILEAANLNKFVNEFITYNDLRICQCADYVFAVYTKLVEYHTNLYDMYEKLVDDLRGEQFDRIMYYRIEICYLLLRSNCLQRLLVEIENGRKFLNKFQQDIINQDNSTYKYQSILTKYTYNLFEAIVLQRTRAICDAKLLCEQSLKELNEINQNRPWEESKSTINLSDSSSVKDRRIQYEQSREILSTFSYTSQTSYIDPLNPFINQYRMEYLICQYYLLQYHLSRHQSHETRNILINLQYHIYPLSFSLPCTIILIEYFYCEMNYNQCFILINNLIQFWWSYVTAREKLELGKLKSLSLIIELKQNSLESAILSGYLAKRILTGYHENIFLIETCINLTLALIGEMRISNIELILQHLEYLSEQTMNCYAKLWYYILVIDVAIELGYELIPITIDFLENISKYRRKLLTGSNQRSLLILYSDCTLAQIYIRLGELNLSKIHFQQALHQIKYDQMHLSTVDFRFKRALLKLIETQLLYWYYIKESEENISKDCFLLTMINTHVNEELIPWNRTRYLIYQAYYDRLINDYKRSQNYPIDNDFNWELNLQEAEQHAIKLDLLWIKRLRTAWFLSLSEQISLQINQCSSIQRSRRSTVMQKPPNRYFLRPSMPHIKITPKTERNSDEQSTKTAHTYSHQNFLDWHLFVSKNSLTQFQLYILPVRV